MRTSLSKYLDRFVLCKGWIGDWEDFPQTKTRRITVLQTTIRKPNKDLLFKEQEIISIEHHINLFIPFNDLTNYDLKFFELREPINFSGVVEHYQRKDGSDDFGIYASKQSTLPFEIYRLKKSVFDSVSFEEKDIKYLTEYALPKVKSLIIRLEKSEECLPTFHDTYAELMGTLIGMEWGVEDRLKEIKSFKESRTYKRLIKKKKSFIEDIKSIKENKPSKEVRNIRNSLGF